MIALIITNIILAVVIGLVGVAVLVDMTRNSRPIIIKEAKALREYYEGKFEELQKKTDEAEEGRANYKKLYESELQKNGGAYSLRGEKIRLEAQVKRLSGELNSCEDRINDMAQENAYLNERIKALEKPAKKGKKKCES